MHDDVLEVDQVAQEPVIDSRVHYQEGRGQQDVGQAVVQVRVGKVGEVVVLLVEHELSHDHVEIDQEHKREM